MRRLTFRVRYLETRLQQCRIVLSHFIVLADVFEYQLGGSRIRGLIRATDVDENNGPLDRDDESERGRGDEIIRELKIRSSERVLASGSLESRFVAFR